MDGYWRAHEPQVDKLCKYKEFSSWNTEFFLFYYFFTERWEGNVNSFRYFAAFMKVMNTGNHLHTFPLPPKNISTWMNRIKVGRMYTKTILVKQWKDPFAVTNHLILFTHLLTYVRSTKCILLHTSLLMSESRYLLKGFLSMASRWLMQILHIFEFGPAS